MKWRGTEREKKWRAEYKRKNYVPRTYSDRERCSHCDKPMREGGTIHGQGTYCRKCTITHIVKGGWFSNRSCTHCRQAGVPSWALQRVA